MKIWDRIIIGEGWGALATLLQKGSVESEQWLWIRGSGAHLFQPSVEASQVASERYVALLAKFLGENTEPTEVGEMERSRVWKNKSFRLPLWSEEETEELKVDAARGALWTPEAAWLPMTLERAAFEEPIWELETRARKKLEEEGLPGLQVVSADPIEDMEWSESWVECVLGSGNRFRARSVFYGDRIVDLARFPGCPVRWTVDGKQKSLKEIMIKGKATGVIQVRLMHEAPQAQWVGHTWVLPCQREPGEKQDRHVIGSLSSDGLSSLWTLTLTTEEVESNQLVAKKLRRIKQALSKCFENEFKIQDEQVRFEESAWMTEGEAPTPVFVCEQGETRVVALSDAWGFEAAVSAWLQTQAFDPTSSSVQPEQSHESQASTSAT